ncbi:MAG: 4a-hydroxytetrahydrobiopterin dehydratase [Methylobacter sp.]|jgi:4a-hydroxytetrahydrobiopterin dehydratase|uniref:4a-hydroxytetrahydrobiopterin dehydratase n=1 Tax=Methylobacter sp. TaxID=2051955 RepID=UPI0025CD94CF|nr:4a-hydroxytetrahydrobiopterin dehydratase [Methylobacter sp.]MCK9623042.1 4a-hydroxytetrahydrobiopterin dehydratase [Methylobacter sp.]
MTDDLTRKTCEVCRMGAPLATQEEIDEYMPQLKGWEIVEIDGIKRLQKTFKFNDFEDALLFTDKVGVLCEQENHHPSILTEWGRVTVTWWSHKIKGLHANDFIMAAKTDALL